MDTEKRLPLDKDTRWQYINIEDWGRDSGYVVRLDHGVVPTCWYPHRKRADGTWEVLGNAYELTELVNVETGERVSPAPQHGELWVKLAEFYDDDNEELAEVTLLLDSGIL